MLSDPTVTVIQHGLLEHEAAENPHPIYQVARTFRVEVGDPIQQALDAAVLEGGNVTLDPGSHAVPVPLVLDLTGYTSFADEDTVSILGAGSGVTELVGSAGAGGTILTVLGVGTLRLNNVIRGLKFTGPGMTGLAIDNGAYSALDDLLFYNLDRGMHTVDYLTSRLYNVRFQSCRSGLEVGAAAGIAPGNSLSLYGCVFTACRDAGLTMESAALLSMFGGNIEGNGSTGTAPDRYGMRINNPWQGIVAANLYGVWFENNANRADLWIDQGPYPAIVNVEGCTFLRVDADAAKWSTNNIRVDVLDTEAELMLNTRGCSFRGTGAYVPSASRPYIGVNGTGRLARYGDGNAYGSVTELPTRETGSTKASCTFNGTLTPPVAYAPHNVGTITREGVGDYTITLPIDIRPTHNVSVGLNGQGVGYLYGEAVGSIRVRTVNLAGALTDFTSIAVRVI